MVSIVLKSWCELLFSKLNFAEKYFQRRKLSSEFNQEEKSIFHHEDDKKRKIEQILEYDESSVTEIWLKYQCTKCYKVYIYMKKYL